MKNTLKLAQELIRIDSVTPDDKGCQKLMQQYLSALDFDITELKFGSVDNFWGKRGSGSPVFVFAGHTDVVPVGDLSTWHTNPFSAEVKQGMLYGRGAADMKGSLAAMISATDKFIKAHPQHKGTIGYLITSDEEGPAIDGTIKVAEYLKKIKQKVDYCLVCEPSSNNKLGDIIKNGRRGSLNGKLNIIGKQGHIAYPHLANNPIHSAIPALNELCSQIWDEGNEYFPATSFQISNINSGVGVNNVIPNNSEIMFNFRYSTECTDIQLKNRVCAILDKYDFKYDIEWGHSGYPFLTPAGVLTDSCIQAIKTVREIDTKLSTAGGTSDGRFIAPILNAQIVELGPLNATIHQTNECVSVADLNDLTDMYYHILKNILT